MAELFTDFAAGENPLTAVAGNLRLQEIENAIIGIPAAAMTVIQPWTELSIAATTITISSIPATSKHLHLFFTPHGTDATNPRDLGIRFNGDTGSNYKGRRGIVRVVSPLITYMSSTLFQSGIQSGPGASFLEDQSAVEMIIMEYQSTTKKKSCIIKNASIIDGSNGVRLELIAGWWNAAIAAITSITLTLAAGDFMAGTTYELLGSS